MKTISPQALGLGLRLPFFQEAWEAEDGAEFYEIIAENFLDSETPLQQKIIAFAKRHPLVIHGVGGNLLGTDNLDEAYLDKLKALADAVDAPYVSDHLCWSRADGVVLHDLLPAPMTEDLVGYAAERIAYVRSRLDRPYAVENLSSYSLLAESHLREEEFVRRVVLESGCSLLLDINNVFVSAANLGFDPYRYLDHLHDVPILQIHLAGHEEPSPGQGSLRIDTHDESPLDEVLQLYRYVCQSRGMFPTLLEWDAKIPPFRDLLRELYRIREYQ